MARRLANRMPRDLFLKVDCEDPSRGGLVKSFFDDTPVEPPNFYRSDYGKFRIFYVKANPSKVTGRPLAKADRPVTTTLASGLIDVAPDGGTFTVTDPSGAQTTGAIAYNAVAATTVQTAIRTLTTNYSAALVTGNAGGPYTVDRGVTGAFATDLTASSAGLTPSGSTVEINNIQDGTSLINEKWQIRLKKAYPILNTAWTDFAPDAAASSVSQSGSSTASKVYSLSWSPDAIDGDTYWAVSSTGSDIQTVGPIAYNATAEQVQDAFALHSALVTAGDVLVSQVGPGSYSVKFKLSLANTPTIGATPATDNLVFLNGDEADIAVSTAGADAILGTAEDEDTIFSIEIKEDSARPRTVVQQANKLYKDLISNTPGQQTGSALDYLHEEDVEAGGTLDIYGATFNSGVGGFRLYTGGIDTGSAIIFEDSGSIMRFDVLGTEQFRINGGTLLVASNVVIQLGTGGQLKCDKTITAGGTTGNQTINKMAGSVNFAAAADTLTVTNSLVTTSSVIVATVATSDATMRSITAVAASGSFALTSPAAATAETRVNFLVIN